MFKRTQDELTQQLATMQVNLAALEKRGGRIKTRDCGGRLCIEASSNQGNGLTDWKGPWNNEKDQVLLVIPNSY